MDSLDKKDGGYSILLGILFFSLMKCGSDNSDLNMRVGALHEQLREYKDSLSIEKSTDSIVEIYNEQEPPEPYDPRH